MALLRIDGVDDVFQTATRTTFVTADGRRLTRAAIEAALATERMRLVGFAVEERSRNVDAWIADTSGIGCSTRAREIRAALVALPGVIDAFVERSSIVLHVEVGTELDLAGLSAPLGGLEVKLTYLKRDARYGFPEPG